MFNLFSKYNGISNISFQSTSNECEDDETNVPMGCSSAIAWFGCDNHVGFDSSNPLVSDACAQSCDACGGSSEPVEGCTDEDADNYNPSATVDDGSCLIEQGFCKVCNFLNS